MGIERRLMAILRMRIAAGRVSLPNLDEGVGNGPPILIEDTPADDDALANRLATVEVGQVGIAWSDDLAPEARAGDFRQRMFDTNEGLTRRALDGAHVGVVRISRMRTLLVAAIGVRHLTISLLGQTYFLILHPGPAMKGNRAVPILS